MLCWILLYIKHDFPFGLKQIKLCKIRGGTGVRKGISEHAEEIIYAIEHKLLFL